MKKRLHNLSKFLLPDYAGERAIIMANLDRRAVALHMGDFINITETQKRTKGTR